MPKSKHSSLAGGGRFNSLNNTINNKTTYKRSQGGTNISALSPAISPKAKTGENFRKTAQRTVAGSSFLAETDGAVYSNIGASTAPFESKEVINSSRSRPTTLRKQNELSKMVQSGGGA